MATCYSAGRLRLTSLDGWRPADPGYVNYDGNATLDGVDIGRVYLQLWSDSTVISCGLAEPSFEQNQVCIDVVDLGQAPGC